MEIINLTEVPVERTELPNGYSTRSLMVVNRFTSETHSIAIMLPVFAYDNYGITAFPMSKIVGDKITLDFSQWSFFDHRRNRPVGNLAVAARNPNESEMWKVVRTYIREARSLDNDELVTWIAEFIQRADEVSARKESDNANARG